MHVTSEYGYNEEYFYRTSQINPEYYVIDVFKSLHPFDQDLKFFIVMNYNT